MEVEKHITIDLEAENKELYCMPVGERLKKATSR
jgi:hypothetical protein